MIMNRVTFTYALEVLHNAVWNAEFLEDEDCEESCVNKLFECYIGMLSNFDKDSVDMIVEFLGDEQFDLIKAYMMYEYLFIDNKQIIEN